MAKANGVPRGRDLTVELRKEFDDPSTEWVPWKEVKDGLRKLDEQESRERVAQNPAAVAKAR